MLTIPRSAGVLGLCTVLRYRWTAATSSTSDLKGVHISVPFIPWLDLASSECCGCACQVSLLAIPLTSDLTCSPSFDSSTEQIFALETISTWYGGVSTSSIVLMTLALVAVLGAVYTLLFTLVSENFHQSSADCCLHHCTGVPKLPARTTAGPECSLRTARIRCCPHRPPHSWLFRASSLHFPIRVVIRRVLCSCKLSH